MPRITRYQGAIIRDHQILLIKQTEHASGRSYWLIPGGGIEPDETEEMCVQREMQEETCLHVQVQYLLLDEPSMLGEFYQRRKTYVCHILDGEARPGYEPEEEYATAYSFTEIGWFDLRNATSWDEQVVSNPITYSLLQRIQAALGYAEATRP
ncbi:MAG: NUDIX domain-containing protein [Chloroflexales bacterium]|nr:NUDIX domain-containing protein [Chloroflexales bacterium]